MVRRSVKRSAVWVRWELEEYTLGKTSRAEVFCAAYFPLYAAAAFSAPLSVMHSAASAAW